MNSFRIWFLVFFLTLLIFYAFLQWKLRRGQKKCPSTGNHWDNIQSAQQHQHTNPIYNISGGVQRSEDRSPHYPSDAFLSINHIQTHFQNTSETNKPTTIIDAPPSYEEAVKMVQSTTTTTTTTTTSVLPAVHRPPTQTE